MAGMHRSLPPDPGTTRIVDRPVSPVARRLASGDRGLRGASEPPIDKAASLRAAGAGSQWGIGARCDPRAHPFSLPGCPPVTMATSCRPDVISPGTNAIPDSTRDAVEHRDPELPAIGIIGAGRLAVGEGHQRRRTVVCA